MKPYAILILLIVVVICWVLASLVFWGAWNYSVGQFVTSVGLPFPSAGGAGTGIDFAHALVFMTAVWAFLSPLIVTGAVIFRAAERLEMAMEGKKRTMSPYQHEAWKTSSVK